MTEIGVLLADSADRMFSDRLSSELREAMDAGEWPAELWAACVALGLDQAAVSEARDGAGLTAADLCTLARLIGRHAVPVPLIETCMAERALAAAGLPPIGSPALPATIAPSTGTDRPVIHRSGHDWVLSGTLRHVPWARFCRTIVLIADGPDGAAHTVVVPAPEPATLATNYAREPRDDFDLAGLSVPDTAVGVGFSVDDLRFEGALFRAAQLAGAMERILEITVTYAKERQQFGRPIAKFQAIQQQIAQLAGEAAAASAASYGAGDARSDGPARFEIACAKLRASEAAGVVAAIAHQVHGAMGFAHEYHLHYLTRRLWSWRDEFGSETVWAEWVGAIVKRVGGEGLWAFLVKPDEDLTAGPISEAG
jgi:acyl-CoA dehydrogenase